MKEQILVTLLLTMGHFKGFRGGMFPDTCVNDPDCSNVVRYSWCLPLGTRMTCACENGNNPAYYVEQKATEDICHQGFSAASLSPKPQGSGIGGLCINDAGCLQAGEFCLIQDSICQCLGGWYPNPRDPTVCKRRSGPPVPIPVPVPVPVQPPPQKNRSKKGKADDDELDEIVIRGGAGSKVILLIKWIIIIMTFLNVIYTSQI